MPDLSVVAMVCVVICFAFGPGCIAWFIIAEMVPIDARGTATAVGLGVNAFANWFVAFMFPHALAFCGRWTFVIFVVSTFVFFMGTLRLLPETKGRTVAEMQRFFERKYEETGGTTAGAKKKSKLCEDLL